VSMIDWETNVNPNFKAKHFRPPLPVKPVAELADESLDAVVIATFDRPEPHAAQLVGFGVPPAKILTLRAPAPGSAIRRA